MNRVLRSLEWKAFTRCKLWWIYVTGFCLLHELKWRLQWKCNTVSNRPQWRFKVAFHCCRTHNGQFYIFYVCFFFVFFGFFLLFQRFKEWSWEDGVFFSHVHLHCQNLDRTITPTQVDRWQFTQRFRSVFALSSYCSLELVASSRNEEQAIELNF